MKVTIVQCSTLAGCLSAAGVCRGSKNKNRALANALKAGHESLLRHWSASFSIEGISRVTSHQLVRHNTGIDFTQQSQRHVKIDAVDWYVVPPSIKNDKQALAAYIVLMERAAAGYKSLLNNSAAQSVAHAVSAETDLGVCKIPLEDSRYVLPGATKTDIIVTANAQALSNFFRARCCSRAQWEIRELAVKMLSLCRKAAEELFRGPFPDCDRCKEPCKDTYLPRK